MIPDSNPSYSIFPLGDCGATISLGTGINHGLNDKALAMQHWLTTNRFAGYNDCSAAYSSLTVWYNPNEIRKAYRVAGSVFEWVKEYLEKAYENVSPSREEESGDFVEIPVCYDQSFANDLDNVMREKNLSKEDIIRLHTTPVYRVYMIGFLPGFPYMAPVHEMLQMPRKPQPVTVAKGSVGITGMQTGIYPFESPGGWQIIGRTPITMFNPEKELKPALLKAGDHVQFVSITKELFYEGNWE